MKKRGRSKNGSLFSRGRKERAEKKRGSGGRLCLVDRPEKTAGRRNSKTSAAKGCEARRKRGSAHHFLHFGFQMLDVYVARHDRTAGVNQ